MSWWFFSPYPKVARNLHNIRCSADHLEVEIAVQSVLKELSSSHDLVCGWSYGQSELASSFTVPYRSSLQYNRMGTWRQSWTQIEAFIHSRLKGRDSSVLSPEPAPSGVYKFISTARIYPLWKTSQDEAPAPSTSSTLPKSKSFVCFCSYGLVSYSGSLTLTSSGRCKIRWLNYILEVVATILAA